MFMERRGLLLPLRRLSVRAALGVDAAGRKPQTLNGAASHEVLGDYLVHIPRVDVAIPDCLRVDHDHRTVLALIEAA